MNESISRKKKWSSFFSFICIRPSAIIMYLSFLSHAHQTPAQKSLFFQHSWIYVFRYAMFNISARDSIRGKTAMQIESRTEISMECSSSFLFTPTIVWRAHSIIIYWPLPSGYYHDYLLLFMHMLTVSTTYRISCVNTRAPQFTKLRLWFICAMCAISFDILTNKFDLYESKH